MSAAETKSYLIQPEYRLWNGAEFSFATGEFVGVDGSLASGLEANNESQYAFGLTITMDMFWLDVPVNNNSANGATLICRNNRITAFTIVIDQATGMFRETGFNTFGKRTGSIGPGISVLYTQNNGDIDLTACGARVTIT